MRRKLPFVIALLLVPASVYANPIDLSGLPPHPSVLCALLVEVIVVTALVWRCHLKMLLFFLFWYAINLFSFYLLFQGFFHLMDLVDPSARLRWVTPITAEVLVVLAEATALYGLSRLPLLQTADSKPVSWPWAFLASFLGNLASIVTFPIFLWIKWR